MNKHFISANELLEDAFRLAARILESGYRPDLIIAVWRGGTPVAIAIHEYFQYKGHKTDHIAIRASSYTGINQRSKSVEITGLEYASEHTVAESKLLIVDDVFDTGNSFRTILEHLVRDLGEDILDRTRIACPWYKPANNQTSLQPDYYLHETADWLVFPHELCGLKLEEIMAGKPVIGRIIG